MTQMDLFQTATSYPVAIPANHLVSPGSREAKKMTATSGRKYLPLFKQNAPLGLFAKMFMDTLAWGSTQCFLTWKPKVTPANRLLFQLVPSTPHTEETGSGLLHTPTATANQMAPSMRKRDPGSWWATPRTTDATGGPRQLDERGRRISKSSNLVFGANLADQVKMWPTPTTRDHKGGYLGGRMRNGKVSMDTLDVAVQHTDNQQKSGGQLNPQWVEWLMGYPSGWTDLKD